MIKKHQNVYAAMNYIEQLIILLVKNLTFATTRCASIFAFAVLVVIPVVTSSFALG